jgi:non-canonical (house-cleaning) NTP pyrophosphatase
VVEAGVHELPHGTIWEAGLYDMDGTNQWFTVSMNHDFGLPPVVLQTLQSDNEEHAVITRLSSVTGITFKS